MRASAIVSEVFNSEKLTGTQSVDLLKKYQPKLNFASEQIKRWSGKRYLVLVDVRDIRSMKPFAIDRREYGNMDDWLLVETIENVRK